MDLGIAGRVAIVTGGASGIGAATVRLLAQEGVRVAVWDLTAQETVGAELIQSVDVTSLTAVAAAWQHTEEHLGSVDILVHAAAIGSGHFGFPYTRVPVSAWDRVLQVNILGMVHLAHVAGPAMQSRGQGAMVFLASVAGQIGSQTDPPYSASKAANINFAQCIAKDLAASGVRVNSVCPGMVKTPLNESVWKSWHDQQPAEKRRSYEDWAADKIHQVIPLRRWQQPDDIAAMIVFLCSARAGEVTGQTINVDGGCVMHS
ncbi:MAG: SDR family oxidoreductase [Planctomycetota bacterium]|nr:MAG: SDR family oxidoreductase [Planctomycetota bacterium]